jgi:hypothetical protein
VYSDFTAIVGERSKILLSFFLVIRFLGGSCFFVSVLLFSFTWKVYDPSTDLGSNESKTLSVSLISGLVGLELMS